MGGHRDPNTWNCSYCGRQCMGEQLLSLHKGHEHKNELTESERTDYENAVAAEEKALRRYRLKVLLVVTVLYFGFLFTYRLVG